MTTAYVSRSARIVFGDSGWWWKALALAAVGLVPLIGVVFQLGYRMAFMRRVAWGIQDGLPGFEDVAGTFKNGINGIVVVFVWSLITMPFVLVAIAAVLFAWIPSALQSGAAATPPMLPWWFTPAVAVPGIVVNVWSMVAVLRTAIYTTTRAGLSFSQVVALTRRERSGFLRATGLMIAVSLAGLALGAPAQYLARATVGTSLTYAWAFLVGLLMMPASLMSTAAYGLWAQETDPTSWPPLESQTSQSAA